MFAILWFLFVAFTATVSLVWILDHNGSVVITWLGYEAKTDILTTLLITIFFAAIVFLISYLLARILAMKFPNLFKLFFKKSYVKRLESLIHKHWQGIDILQQLLLSIESEDAKTSENLQKKLAVLIKNPRLNNFFIAKIAYQNSEFSKAADFFSKIEDSKFARLMALKSKFELALEKQDNATAIAYAKQILSIKSDSRKTAKSLLILYRKTGLWQEARALIEQYGIDKFGDEFQKREIAAINTAIAFDFYQKKNFSNAIKYAKIALKSDELFLPAYEVTLKSWIKRGFAFRASFIIKKLWKENPHLLFAEIYDLIHRKSSAKNRIKAMKKLTSLNKNSNLNDLALGIVALRCKKYQEAKEFLSYAILKDKTYRAYKALAFIEKILGNSDRAASCLEKAELISQGEHNYICNNCNSPSPSWKPNCSNCKTVNSLEWSN